jgi:hypothetical protein
LIALPAAERKRYLAARTHALRPTSMDAPTDPVMIRRAAVEDATMAAVCKYQPQPFDGHIDLMLPCEAWKHSSDAPLRWSGFAASTTEFTGSDDCNGDTMLLPEHAPTFAALINAARQRHSTGPAP